MITTTTSSSSSVKPRVRNDNDSEARASWGPIDFPFPTGMLDEKPRPERRRRRLSDLHAGDLCALEKPIASTPFLCSGALLKTARRSPLRIGTQIGWRPTRWAGPKFIFIAHEPMKESNLYWAHRRTSWPGSRTDKKAPTRSQQFPQGQRRQRLCGRADR